MGGGVLGRWTRDKQRLRWWPMKRSGKSGASSQHPSPPLPLFWPLSPLIPTVIPHVPAP